MHQIRYEWKEQLQDCLPYAGLTLLMGCGVFVLSRFTSAWAPFWQLAAGGATGAVLYLTPGIFFREPLMTRMVCWGKHLCEEYWERIGRRRESC